MHLVHESTHATARLAANGVATLQVANAGRLNLIGSAAIRDLGDALAALAAQPNLRVLLGGDSIDAARAEAWGLVHERCATGDLDDLVQARAENLAALPPLALRQQKRLLRDWQNLTPAQAIEDSVAEFAQAYCTGEPQALMAEFMARKRARPSG